jgi:hypothetical protein
VKLLDYDLKVHWRKDRGELTYALELTPREDYLVQPYVAVLASEALRLRDRCAGHGLPGDAWYGQQLAYTPPFDEPGDRAWRVYRPRLRISPVQSCFLYCNRIPSFLAFGALGAQQRRIALVPSPTHRTSAPPRLPPGLAGFLSGATEWDLWCVPMPAP